MILLEGKVESWKYFYEFQHLGFLLIRSLL